MRVRTAAEESPSSERGRPAAPRLAAMTEAGREGSELWWGRRDGKVALSSEEDAGALRRQALPNVWHQRRAQRVRCMPGLGSADRNQGGKCWRWCMTNDAELVPSPAVKRGEATRW